MDVRAWAEDTTVSSDEESTSAVKLVEADVFKSRLQFGLSDRIKYSCFDFSERWLVCGTGAGSVHVFERGIYKLQRIVPLKEGAVRRLAICEDGCESWIAYACDSGAVGIILLDRGREEIDASWPPLALKSTPLCIVWAPSSSSSPSSDCDEDEETCTKCLFVGDSQGQVTQCVVSNQRPLCNTMFRDAAVKLASFDAPVVQIDAPAGTDGRFLLVSTSRRTYVVDCLRALYVAVGKKARDASLGACFGPSATSVFAVRPGRRLWEAELDGRVKRTIQLPPGDVEPDKVVACLGSAAARRSGSEEPFLSFVLFEPRSGLLVGYSSNFVLFIRPEDGHVVSAVTTSSSSASILDVKVRRGSVFVQFKHGNDKSPTSLAQFDVAGAGDAEPDSCEDDVEEDGAPDRTAGRADGDDSSGLDRSLDSGIDKDERGSPADLNDARPGREDADCGTTWYDPSGDLTMMAAGYYSPEVFQFNDVFFQDLSAKMKETFSKWTLAITSSAGAGPADTASSPKLTKKPLRADAVQAPESPVVVVAGTKMATDVKTLVRELGEKSKLVISLLDKSSEMTLEERRALGDNWVRYLVGFPDAVLAATRFRFPASAWTAIVPPDVREANAELIVVVCTYTGLFAATTSDPGTGTGTEHEGDVELLFQDLAEEETAWITSVAKVWFLVDGEAVLNAVSKLDESVGLRARRRLWRLAKELLANSCPAAGGPYNGLSAPSPEALSRFPKRTWLPMSTTVFGLGPDGAGKFARFLSEASASSKEDLLCRQLVTSFELLFLLADLSSNAECFPDVLRAFWRSARETDDSLLDVVVQSCRLAALTSALLDVVYFRPEGETGELVDIGVRAGWLNVESVEALFRRLSSTDPHAPRQRWEDLTSVALRAVGGEATLELLEKYGDSVELSKTCLFKLMVCCRAEKRYRLDCSTAAGCLRAENSATRSTLVAHRIFSSAAPDLSRAQKPFHHWNVQVDVTAACASCGVSLRNANMLFPGSCGDGSCGTRERPSGLTVFRCGHAYHAACLSDHSQYRPKSCFVCLR